ncbi:MAG: hypothetical protein U0229_02820 [Anaeromyxobacter sp.]
MRFASKEWLAAVVEALNRQPALPQALQGLGRDGGIVVGRDGAAWPRDVAAYGLHEGGRLVGCRVLPDPDDLLELEPAYVFRAPYGVWRAVMLGEDPVRAALSGRVRVEGDLEALVRRVEYRRVVDAALAAVPTEFP